MRMTNVVVISGRRGCLRPSTFSCSRHFSVYIKLNHSGVAPPSFVGRIYEMEERRKKLRMKLNVKEYYVSSPLSSPPSPPPALRIMIFFACQDILDEIAPPPLNLKTTLCACIG